MTRQVPEGYVEIVRLARLWSAVPPEERVTPDQVAKAHDFYGDNEYRRALIARDEAILLHPRCEIAVQPQEYGGRWMPCRRPLADEMQTRCAQHGGPRKPQPRRETLAELRAEIERLTSRLVLLSAQREAVAQ